MMLSWKMAACLAVGNTVVLKPAEVTPLTALKFAELSVLAGIPPGVINIVPGPGKLAGQALGKHSLVRKIGFTGSTRVGYDIMRYAADSNLKKVSLELGGKSPLIIFSDANLDRAVKLVSICTFFKCKSGKNVRIHFFPFYFDATFFFALKGDFFHYFPFLNFHFNI